MFRSTIILSFLFLLTIVTGLPHLQAREEPETQYQRAQQKFYINTWDWPSDKFENLHTALKANGAFKFSQELKNKGVSTISSVQEVKIKQGGKQLLVQVGNARNTLLWILAGDEILEYVKKVSPCSVNAEKDDPYEAKIRKQYGIPVPS